MKESELDATELIRDLITETRRLPLGDESKLDKLQRRVRMAIRRIFGDLHAHRLECDQIRFPSKYLSDTEEFLDYWAASEQELLNFLETMLEEVEVFGLPLPQELVDDPAPKVSNRVFLAHGHDEGMRESVARVLEKLGLEAVILREQPRSGRTVVEQIEHNSDIPFALILLSPDDMAYRIGLPASKARPRARQNVVHELGFFTGRLGRKNVLVLYKKEQDFEMPSNHSGVLYVPYDSRGHWKFALTRELRECGYVVDANYLL